MSLKVDILEWDSDFFGFKIARININKSNSSNIFELPEIISHLKITMVYLIMDEYDANAHEQLLKIGAILVDRKTTYSKSVKEPIKINDCYFPLVEFEEKHFTDDLIKLAFASGIYSRFLLDKRFGRKSYEKLYSEWLDKSINKKLADKVWVALDDKKVVGFVTVKRNHENKSGQIGLIAVSEHYRGKKIGQSLMEKCDKWYFENNLNIAKVVTQGDNMAACSFYETAGYSIEKVDYYYHLWNPTS